MNDLLMGISGAGTAQPGIHLCALFSGPVERDLLLVEYLQEGLRQGDQCVCLMDEIEPFSLRSRAYAPAGVGDSHRPGSLDLHAAPDAYLHSGPRSPQQRMSGFTADLRPSPGRGRPRLRLAGQMPHDASREPGSSDFDTYESAVLLILAEVPAVFLCLYDMRRFGTALLAHVLKIHSQVLLDGVVLYNPQSVVLAPRTEPPVPWHNPFTGRMEGADPWVLLTAAEIRIAVLIGGGMTNRAAPRN